ncbi:FKBP-type peptidyl-prolyl cis-trans isomerase [candidate division KSB1 bacterium]|nr:FKBP-type peptidyl-prolyl cis-trans isomerase [candidate division KSB1 bacterium]
MIHYIAKLSNGRIVASTGDKSPAKITIGNDEIPRRLETRIIGMAEGEDEKVFLPAAKAYGYYRHDLVFKVNKQRFANLNQPEVGAEYEIKQANGKSLRARVTRVEDSEVTLDANHELAGEDILYEVSLVKICR